jgi:hypothetical protein
VKQGFKGFKETLELKVSKVMQVNKVKQDYKAILELKVFKA